MKYVIKYLFYEIISPLALFFGVDKLLRKQSSQRRLIIMYHGVSAGRNFSINGRHLPSEEFEKHLKYFKTNFDVVSLKELCDKKKLQSQGKHSIAITFDDGYLNNIQHAMPLLLKYGLPATFFVSTKSLHEPEYIHPADYLDIIRASSSEVLEINGTLFYDSNKQPGSPDNDPYSFINSLRFDEFKETLVKLKSKYPVKNMVKRIDPDVYRVVSSEMIEKFSSNDLFAVGSHSHDHVNLSVLSKEEVKHQVGLSKKILEMHAPGSINSIAFPYGYFNKNVIECSMQEGYIYLLAAGDVTNEFKNQVFPRVGILNMAGYAFNMLSINHGFQRFGF